MIYARITFVTPNLTPEKNDGIPHCKESRQCNFHAKYKNCTDCVCDVVFHMFSFLLLAGEEVVTLVVVQLTGWDRFVSIKIKSWELFYMDWLSSSATKVKVVHFENLRDMLQWNLLSILDFLNLRPDPGRIQCLLQHEEGLFRRKSPGSLDFDPFTAGQKQKIRRAIDKVNEALQKASKETMPLHKYDFL